MYLSFTRSKLSKQYLFLYQPLKPWTILILTSKWEEISFMANLIHRFFLLFFVTNDFQRSIYVCLTGLYPLITQIPFWRKLCNLDCTLVFWKLSRSYICLHWGEN